MKNTIADTITVMHNSKHLITLKVCITQKRRKRK